MQDVVPLSRDNGPLTSHTGCESHEREPTASHGTRGSARAAKDKELRRGGTDGTCSVSHDKNAATLYATHFRGRRGLDVDHVAVPKLAWRQLLA